MGADPKRRPQVLRAGQEQADSRACTRGWTFPEAVKLALAKLRCRLCKTSPAPHLWGEPTPMLVCDKCLALGDATIQAKWYALDAREKARRKPRRLEA